MHTAGHNEKTVANFLPLLDDRSYPSKTDGLTKGNTSSSGGHAQEFQTLAHDSAALIHPRVHHDPTHGNNSFSPSGSILATAPTLERLHTTGEHVSLRERYTQERAVFLQAGNYLFGAMEDGLNENIIRIGHGASYNRFRDSWRRVQILNTELDNLDTYSGPTYSFPRAQEPLSPAPSHGDSVRNHHVLNESTGVSLYASHGAEPDYAEFYYENASAVRWLSDDLINLGSRPADGEGLESEVSGNDDASESMTPYEYAQAHLRILKDLDYRRSEAAKYKQICLDKGILLDEITTGEDVEPAENTYQSLLDELEYGASRVDSMVAVNHGQHQYQTLTMPPGDSKKSSRIAEWATSISEDYGIESPSYDEQTARPTFTFTEHTEPLSMATELGSVSHEVPFASKRHNRSKSSTFPLNLAVAVTGLKRRSSTCSTRKDFRVGSNANSQCYSSPMVC